MAADALAAYITTALAAMVLTMLDKQLLAFHEEGFQLLTKSVCREMIKIANTHLCFLNMIQHIQS